MRTIKKFLVLVALVILSASVLAQSIEVSVKDNRAEGPQVFVYGKNPSIPIPELKDTFWHDAGIFPQNQYNIDLSLVDDVQSKSIFIKPSSTDKMWVISAVYLSSAGIEKANIQIDISFGIFSLNSFPNKCYSRTFELSGVIDNFIGQQWETIDAIDGEGVIGGGCGLVTRVNYTTVPKQQLKFKDTGILPSFLGKIPNEGQEQKFEEEKTVLVSTNGEIIATVTHNNDQGNLKQKDSVKLTHKSVNPWNDEGDNQFDMMAPDGIFRIDMERSKGEPALILTLNNSGKNYRIEAEKIDQQILGLKKNVRFKVYKNSTGNGSACFTGEFEIDAVIPFGNNGFNNFLTVPAGPWLPIHARECGLMFQVKGEPNSDILFFREIGPTFLELEGDKTSSQEVATTNAVETAIEVNNRDTAQTDISNTSTQRAEKEFQASGGVIKQYYVRFDPEDVQRIGASLGTVFRDGLLGLIGVGEKRNESDVYNKIIEYLTIQDAAGKNVKVHKSMPTAGICFSRCAFVNPSIKMEGSVLPTGTLLIPDSEPHPAIVLKNIKPGIYYVTYKFPNFPTIRTQWGIEFDPLKPIDERFLGTGDNVAVAN